MRMKLIVHGDGLVGVKINKIFTNFFLKNRQKKMLKYFCAASFGYLDYR